MLNSSSRNVVLFLLSFSIFLLSILYAVNSLFFIFILLSFGVASIPLLVAIQRRSIDLFEPIMFKSIFMYMILIGLLDRFYLSDPFLRHEQWIVFSFETGFVFLSILYLSLFLSIMYGYYRRFPDTTHLQNIFPTAEQHQTVLVRRIAVLYMIIGACAYILLLGNALNWDPFYLYTTSEPRSQIFSDSSSSLLQLLARASFVGLFLYISALIAQGKSPRLREFVAFGVILILFGLLGGRGLMLQIFLIMAIILYYVWVQELISVEKNHIHFLDPTDQNVMKITILPLLGIPIAVLTLSARYMRQSYGFIESILAVDYIRVLTFGINNDRFDYFLILLSTDEIPHSFGTRYLRVPLNFIPRSFWSNKPVLTLGSDLRRHVLPEEAGGRPPGEIGTYYAEFGYPGIVLLGILYGFILRATYEMLRGNSESPLAIITYSIILIPLVVGGLTNNALWGILANLLWLFPVLVLHRL